MFVAALLIKVELVPIYFRLPGLIKFWLTVRVDLLCCSLRTYSLGVLGINSFDRVLLKGSFRPEFEKLLFACLIFSLCNGLTEEELGGFFTDDEKKLLYCCYCWRAVYLRIGTALCSPVQGIIDLGLLALWLIVKFSWSNALISNILLVDFFMLLPGWTRFSCSRDYSELMYWSIMFICSGPISLLSRRSFSVWSASWALNS